MGEMKWILWIFIPGKEGGKRGEIRKGGGGRERMGEWEKWGDLQMRVGGGVEFSIGCTEEP